MKTDTQVHEAVVLSNSKELQTNLEKENITDIVILDLKNKYSGLEIKGINDDEGYKVAQDARKEVKRIRLIAEKEVKKITDKYYQAHKDSVADGRKILLRFNEIESAIESKISVIDAEVERLAEIEAEKQKAKIQQRIKDLQAFNYQGDLIAVEFLSDEQFNEKLSGAKAEHEAALAKAAEEKRLREEETARLAKQKEEQDARERELLRLEQERIDAAYKIKQEQDAKEKEFADREAKLKAEELRIENEKKEAAAKIIRDKELKEAQEMAAAKALADQKAAEEKAVKEKAESERLEALKPVKELLTYWIDDLKIDPPQSLAENETALAILEKFHSFKSWAKKEIDSLS